MAHRVGLLAALVFTIRLLQEACTACGWRIILAGKVSFGDGWLVGVLALGRALPAPITLYLIIF